MEKNYGPHTIEDLENDYSEVTKDDSNDTTVDKIIRYIKNNPDVSNDTIFCTFMTCDDQDIEEARAYTEGSYDAVEMGINII